MERNITLDYFKIILSILVITIHAQPILEDNGIANWLICNGIARIAVPFFFLVSGYYIAPILTQKSKVKKYITHILIVYLVWSILYLPLYVFSMEGIALYTNLIYGYYHLWYLLALAIAMSILYVLHNRISDTSIILLAIALYLICYYLEITKNINFFPIYKNGILFGFPFVALGYYIHRKNFVEHLSTRILTIITLAAFAAFLLESVNRYILGGYPDILLNTFILCPSIFLLIIQKGKMAKGSKDISQLSSSIYFVHIAAMYAVQTIFDLPVSYIFLLTVLLSIILSIFIIRINKHIKILL